MSLGAEVMAGKAMALREPSGGDDPELCIARGLHGPSAGPVQHLLNRMSANNGEKWKDTYKIYSWGSRAGASVFFGWDKFLEAVQNKMLTHFSDFEIESATKNQSYRFLKMQCRHCLSWTMVNYHKETSGEEARAQVVGPLAGFLCLQEAADPVSNDTV